MPNSTSNTIPIFAKAAFIRRDAALVREANICGVLLTENCVPSIATSRQPW